MSKRPDALARFALMMIIVLTNTALAAPQSYLDEDTAVTVTVVSQPMVFAREYPALAVHARDYLSLCGLQVNRAGKLRQYLLAYLWSTIDRRMTSDDAAAMTTSLRLLADDRELDLVVSDSSPRAAGMGHLPCEAPTRKAIPVLYATDVATLTFIASSRRLVVKPRAGNAAEEDIDAYQLWTDGRTALGELAIEIGAPRH